VAEDGAVRALCVGCVTRAKLADAQQKSAREMTRRGANNKGAASGSNVSSGALHISINRKTLERQNSVATLKRGGGGGARPTGGATGAGGGGGSGAARPTAQLSAEIREHFGALDVEVWLIEFESQAIRN
jgi:hypothetical protein